MLEHSIRRSTEVCHQAKRGDEYSRSTRVCGSVDAQQAVKSARTSAEFCDTDVADHAHRLGL